MRHLIALDTTHWYAVKVKINSEKSVGMRHAMALLNEATGELKQKTVYKEAI